MGMTQFFSKITPLVFAVLLTACAAAQDFPKRSVDGKDHYVYTVEPGNTLFAISRSFSVSIESLKQANEGLDEGLEIGREILIPLNAIDKRSARRSDVKTDGEYLMHTVQRKETLFGIAKMYGVTVKDVAELNPDQSVKMSPGMVLRIPVRRSLSVDEAYLEPARNDTFKVHLTAKGETPFSIAKSYGISVDSLAKANPGILENLPVETWITVPVYNDAYLLRLEEQSAASIPKAEYDMPSGVRDEYRIALMLPFELQYNDSVGEMIERGKDLYILTEIALEFYRGVLLAVDSLEKAGLRARIKVYEVGEDLVSARDVIKKIESDKADLVIGPMHKASLALISEYSNKNKFYLVSPNSFSNEVFEDNPYLFRATSSRETLLKYLANFIAVNHRGHNVMMVNSESPKDWPHRKLLKRYYNEAGAIFPNAFRDSLASVTKKMLTAEDAGKYLRKDTLNVLIVPSNELAFVSDLVTKLVRLEREGYPIQVYGLDQWVKYDNIEAAYKNRFKLRLVVPNFVDYEAENVIDYLEQYRSEYKTEPSKFGYGFQGYDLAMYFGGMLLTHGLDFGLHTGGEAMEGVMGSYRFGRSVTGKDFENKSVLIIEYDDYSIKRVN